MLVIAHRGLSAHFPENTEIAFTKALELGVEAIECDIHQVGQQFVVFHDFDLQRLIGKSGYLAELNEMEIAQLEISQGHKVLSLQELFTLINAPVLLNLELKAITDVALFVRSLTQCAKAHPAKVVLSSFNHPLLVSIQEIAHNANTVFKYGALIAHLPYDCKVHAKAVRALGADIAAIDAHMVNKDFVAQAHSEGLDVWCYTVNDEHKLLKLQSMGVDGIFSDDAAWAQNYLRKQGLN